MPRSPVGSLLRMFAAPTSDERRTAARAARERALVDARILPPRELTGLGHVRVGVVGAGFAGLAAAWYLRTCEADVTVFEALDRVGGRVFTDRTFIPGRLVEAGAELIGDNHALWLALARQFGLDLVELTTDEEYAGRGLRTRMRFGDRDLAPQELRELHDGLLPHLDVIGDEARPIDALRPWDSPDAARFDGMSVADRLDQLADLTPLQRAAIAFTLGNDACAPIEVQSYLGLLALVSAGRTGDDTTGMRGYWEASEVYRCAQGNQALAERMAEWLDGTPGTVRTGTPVARIAVTPGRGFAGVTLTTADGVTEDFDAVVLAVPAPQWDAIAFDPPLPVDEYAIDHGPAVKYLTAYDDVDWPRGGLAPSAKWDELGSTWESTDRQRPGEPPFGLTVFSGGEHVLPDADAYAAKLAAFFPDDTPVRAALVDWRATGYSVPTVGQVTTVGRRLGLPHRDHLFFAGEQTSMGFYGYMEGALQSGSLAALALARDALGTAVAPSSPSGVCLPLGHPEGDAAAQAARSRELARVLVRDPAPFAGDRVDVRYTLPADAPAELRTVGALWSGPATVDQMVTMEMPISLALRLGTLLGEDVPVPVRATYGPVQATQTGDVDVTGGAPLGVLAGADFTIRFQDQDRFHLDPLAVLALFERHGLWADTGGVRCPLLPADTADVPALAIAGPTPAVPGAAHLVLSGGSLGRAVHHPPDPLPERYFSFLSHDAVVVTLANPPSEARLTVRDVTEERYRTEATNPIEVALDAPYSFVAETALRPDHPRYRTALPGEAKPGQRQPGPPLTYELAVADPPLRTRISQDTRDVIRQEYRFHNQPFQTTSPLTVPTPAQIERAGRPAFAAHFTAEQFAKSNYFPVERRKGKLTALDPAASYLAGGTEMFRVAEYLRRRYLEHLDRLRAAEPDAVPTTVTPLLVPTSTWRNPERNENVGGVHNSNHQTGKALDITPAQKTAVHARLMECLFAAARDFLQELVDRNGVPAFGDVEILLEENSALLWSYRARPDGTIVDAKGRGYHQGNPPSVAKALPDATHVHVAWKAEREDAPLALPPARSDPPPSSPPFAFRNVILVATDDSSLPPGKRLPINHTAESVRAYLRTVDPDTPTDVHVVADPVAWLSHLNAFEEPTYRIRYLFSFSHAWPGGLELEHYPGGTDYDTVIHDPAVMARLGEIYDPNPFDETSQTLPTGTDDLLTFKTNQIRIANLTFLPEESRRRVRATLADAEGIYVAGCRAAQEEGVPHPPFCAALATLVGKPVRGAAYYSKVYAPDADGDWEERTLTRDDATPAEQPVVLVPGGYGRGQLAAFVFGSGQLPPDVPDFPETSSNLFELYETFLNPCFPEEP